MRKAYLRDLARVEQHCGAFFIFSFEFTVIGYLNPFWQIIIVKQKDGTKP